MANSSRDRELLIPVANTGDGDDVSGDKPSSSSSSSSSSSHHHHHSGRETFSKVVRSWASKKFMTGCVILFPIAVTFYITWWFIHFVDGFFSPIYAQLGIDVFGLGFMTSITFIFLVGVFMSSWLGTSVLGLGEWFIKRMPFVRHIYNASKQISSAISPDQNTQAFKEVAIIRHPRIGEYAFGFITSSVVLQLPSWASRGLHVGPSPIGLHGPRSSSPLDLDHELLFPNTHNFHGLDGCFACFHDVWYHTNYAGDEELCCVYVPTNHLYIGDIFLVNAKDVIRPNLSVREGIEIVVSGGMSMPQTLSTLDPGSIRVDRS
ncbi:Protein LIKE COV 2 [Capsicum annuum]|nr:Protein LIKE COV 2 [Capsicum annuum]